VSESVLDRMQAAMEGKLPGLFGIQLLSIGHGSVEARLDLRPEHLAPNEFLHAGTVITLADSCAGMGCIASMPEGASGFTTVELKTNFLRTAREGALVCRASMVHGGSRTQVWDSIVSREEDDKVIALFRCTQFLLDAEDARTATQRRERAWMEEKGGT
jgi:uncharacterized protein (TIGR00369 family)